MKIIDIHGIFQFSMFDRKKTIDKFPPRVASFCHSSVEGTKFESYRSIR